MKALVYRGPGRLHLDDVPAPEPAPGEALLKVEACGICGTDLRIVRGSHRAYAGNTVRIPGHEIAGTIVASRAGERAREGVRAFIAPNIGCGACASCRVGRVNLCLNPQALGITLDGGFAEYVLLPADLVEQGNVLPVSVGRDPAALALVEPLACVFRGSAACRISAGDLVLIVGAGPIGLLHLEVAKLSRPREIVVSEPNERRRAQAMAWNAGRVVDPVAEDLSAIIGELSGGVGADVIIVAAPARQAQEQAARLAAPGGRVNFFGGLPSGGSDITIDSNLIHYKELLITGTTANTTEDCRQALDLVERGLIDTSRLITDRHTLTEAEEAFAAASSGKGLKVVFEP